MAFYNAEKIKSENKNGGCRKFLMFGLLIICVALVSGVVYANYKWNILKFSAYSCYWDYSTASAVKQPPNTLNGQKIPINITQGSTPAAIGLQLKNAGIIDDPDYFACYVKRTGSAPSMQAGYFEVPVPISIESLVPLLQNSKIPTIRVTVKEGLRYDEIAQTLDDSLSQNNPIKKFSVNEFLTLVEDPNFIAKFPYAKGAPTLEGFLFPDTYDFPKDISATDVITTMTNTFQKKVLEPKGGSLNTGVYTTHDIVTIASIVEKESGPNVQEKQMIADIIRRRFEGSWFLGLDTVLLYEKKDWKHEITVKDKATNTPYNTYLRKGLPPTPICSPGAESINAALHPLANDYWYFIYDTDGVVHFAKTYQEHLQNVAKYL